MKKFLFVNLGLLILSACLPITPATPISTLTQTITTTPTSTVIWFPPTATATAISPTLVPSPTPELRPGIGSIVLEDHFSDAAPWLISQTATSMVGLGDHELSLALSQPKGYLYSVRTEPHFENFYVEITASPSLCNSEDQYGLLLRFNSASSFYRFALSCNGQLRLDRIVSGTASSPQGWLPSASVPSAAPSSSRLGVWMMGEDMRFFVNDQFQFAIHDPMLTSGAIGVFVRSSGETAVTVNFSDFVVYNINP